MMTHKNNQLGDRLLFGYLVFIGLPGAIGFLASQPRGEFSFNTLAIISMVAVAPAVLGVVAAILILLTTFAVWVFTGKKLNL